MSAWSVSIYRQGRWRAPCRSTAQPAKHPSRVLRGRENRRSPDCAVPSQHPNQPPHGLTAAQLHRPEFDGKPSRASSPCASCFLPPSCASRCGDLRSFFQAFFSECEKPTSDFSNKREVLSEKTDSSGAETFSAWRGALRTFGRHGVLCQ